MKVRIKHFQTASESDVLIVQFVYAHTDEIIDTYARTYTNAHKHTTTYTLK